LGWLNRGTQVEWERNARGSECERGWKRSGTVFSCEIDYCTGVYVVYSIETNENERGKHETIRKTRKESKKALITNLETTTSEAQFRQVPFVCITTQSLFFLLSTTANYAILRPWPTAIEIICTFLRSHSYSHGKC